MFDAIVVGTDGSNGALEAVRSAGAVASAFGVTSVHVVAAPGFSDTNIEIIRIRSLLSKAKAETLSLDATLDDRLTEAGTILRAAGVQPITHRVRGDPATAILDVAEEVDADLIVVGARGLGPVGRFLRGSVSPRVAHHAPCSVLIVEHDD
jgi:nucleotide-binding universal stress UspA family protein